MITYYEKARVFKLDTPDTSYMIGIVDEENFVGHIYYGKRLKDAEASYLMRTQEPPFVPSVNNRERCSFYDCFPFEYPTGGVGDYRESCLGFKTAAGGSRMCRMKFLMENQSLKDFQRPLRRMMTA